MIGSLRRWRIDAFSYCETVYAKVRISYGLARIPVWGIRYLEKRNRRSLHGAPPDFLLNLVGPTSFMRLSLRKAAHVALSTAAQQDIRVRSVRDDKG